MFSLNKNNTIIKNITWLINNNQILKRDGILQFWKVGTGVDRVEKWTSSEVVLCPECKTSIMSPDFGVF
ncbi:MAG: hypothetical protein K9M80_05790 [Candidatus Marinimicrobia bacterium]|nr:hypothetical protein [Candidatus Neomarinimicrobiota bacterium]